MARAERSYKESFRGLKPSKRMCGKSELKL